MASELYTNNDGNNIQAFVANPKKSMTPVDMVAGATMEFVMANDLFAMLHLWVTDTCYYYFNDDNVLIFPLMPNSPNIIIIPRGLDKLTITDADAAAPTVYIQGR